MCENINSIDATKIKIPNAYVFESFVEGCKSLQSIKINNIETEVLNLKYFARGCNSLKYISLNTIREPKKIDTDYFAKNCNNLQVANLKFRVQQIDSAYCMFAGCCQLRVINFSNKEGDNSYTNIQCMFQQCEHLRALKIVGIDMKEEAGLFGAEMPEQLKIIYTGNKSVGYLQE